MSIVAEVTTSPAGMKSETLEKLAATQAGPREGRSMDCGLNVVYSPQKLSSGLDMFANTLVLTVSWILSARAAGATASNKAAAKKQVFRIVLIPSGLDG